MASNNNDPKEIYLKNEKNETVIAWYPDATTDKRGLIKKADIPSSTSDLDNDSKYTAIKIRKWNA